MFGIPFAHCTLSSGLKKFPNVDGVVAFSHSTGCGMEQTGEPMQLLQRTLAGYINHPNVFSSLVVGLGCERCQVGGLFHSQDLYEGKNLKTLVIMMSLIKVILTLKN